MRGQYFEARRLRPPHAIALTTLFLLGRRCCRHRRTRRRGRRRWLRRRKFRLLTPSMASPAGRRFLVREILLPYIPHHQNHLPRRPFRFQIIFRKRAKPGNIAPRRRHMAELAPYPQRVRKSLHRPHKLIRRYSLQHLNIFVNLLRRPRIISRGKLLEFLSRSLRHTRRFLLPRATLLPTLLSRRALPRKCRMARRKPNEPDPHHREPHRNRAAHPTPSPSRQPIPHPSPFPRPNSRLPENPLTDSSVRISFSSIHLADSRPGSPEISTGVLNSIYCITNQYVLL